MYLPMPDGRTTLANFFSPLVNHMETCFSRGKPTYPVERTLLTTGLTAAGVESLYRGQERFETPHLAIRYQAPERVDILENLTMLHAHFLQTTLPRRSGAPSASHSRHHLPILRTPSTSATASWSATR